MAIWSNHVVCTHHNLESELKRMEFFNAIPVLVLSSKKSQVHSHNGVPLPP